MTNIARRADHGAGAAPKVLEVPVQRARHMSRDLPGRRGTCAAPSTCLSASSGQVVTNACSFIIECRLNRHARVKVELIASGEPLTLMYSRSSVPECPAGFRESARKVRGPPAFPEATVAAHVGQGVSRAGAYTNQHGGGVALRGAVLAEEVLNDRRGR